MTMTTHCNVYNDIGKMTMDNMTMGKIRIGKMTMGKITMGKITMSKERPLPLKLALALLNNATQLLVILQWKGFRRF